MATTGDLKSLKNFLDYTSLKANELKQKDKAFCSIDETHRTVLPCAVEFPGNSGDPLAQNYCVQTRYMHIYMECEVDSVHWFQIPNTYDLRSIFLYLF